MLANLYASQIVLIVQVARSVFLVRLTTMSIAVVHALSAVMFLNVSAAIPLLALYVPLVSIFLKEYATHVPVFVPPALQLIIAILSMLNLQLVLSWFRQPILLI
jgi:hypothetical protein